MNDQTMISSNQGAVHFDKDTFEETIQNAGDKPVFVDFYAEWCGPCRLAAPVVEKLAQEYGDSAIIAKLDVDDNNEISRQYGVSSIPTVLIFKNGEEADRIVGFPGEAGYRRLLDAAIGAGAGANQRADVAPELGADADMDDAGAAD